MMRKAVASVLLFALAGCGGPERSAEPVLVVGAVLPLSGPAAGAGEQVLVGLRLAAAATTSMPVEVRALDGAGDPLASLRCARELLAQPDVVAIVGGWSPATARPLAAALAAESVPFLALSPHAAPAGGTGGPYALHRLAALGAAAARWSVEDLGAQRAAVLSDPASDSARMLVRAFEDELVAGGGSVAWVIDLDAEGRPIRPAGREPEIDLVFAPVPASAVVAAAGFGRALREAPVVLVDGWDLAAADSLGEGRTVRVVSFWAADDPSTESDELTEALVEIGMPGSPAIAFGWDAIVLLESAAFEAGPDRTAIRAVLGSGLETLGATGRLAGAGPAGVSETPAVSAIEKGSRSFLRRVDVVTGQVSGDAPR
jgi:ABC-type branched-subunit amino acid transport system substrate-binding protein